MIQYKKTFWRRIPVKYVLTASAWRFKLCQAARMPSLWKLRLRCPAAPWLHLMGKSLGK